MSKFIKIQVLDREEPADDYVAFLLPQHVIRVDSTSPQERKKRREGNSVIITSTGSLLCPENAQLFVDRLDKALDAADSAIPQ